MDQRIESFLADVLALAGEEPDTLVNQCRTLNSALVRSESAT